MNSKFEYLGYSPHDGGQYKCRKCGHILSDYELMANNEECLYCKKQQNDVTDLWNVIVQRLTRMETE